MIEIDAIKPKTMVYSYGCRGPREGVEEVDGQIWLAHRYYNKLVELRRAQADECENIRRDKFPAFAASEKAVADANAEIERLLAEIGRANAKERRKTATPEQKASLTAARKARKDAWAQRKEIRAAINADAALQSALAAVYVKYQGTLIPGTERREGGLLKDARSSCGVYWGTYLKSEAAFEMAAKTSKGAPRFARWEHDGQIAVQIQGGATWLDILNRKGRVANLLRVEPLATNRTGKSARPWLVSICIRTDDDRKPVWAKVKMYLHRDLPADAVVMGAALVRKASAVHRMSDGTFKPNYSWSLQFTLRTFEKKPRATTGAVGIDLGWRLMPDGSIRVAYWLGDDDKKGELRLPASVLSRWEKSRSLQGIRDRNFDAMRARLANWKATLPVIPEWLAEATKFMGQWRAKGKLARVVIGWQPIDGDGEILAELKAWQLQDAHLWQWEVANTRKAQRIRLHLYREFAAEMRKRYARVIVEDCDWRELARKPGVAEDSDHGARTYMRAGAVGLLRGLLVQDGAKPSESADTTKKCSFCESPEEWDQATELVHTCERCGEVWDQDENAARNLLARGKVLDETPETARDANSEVAKGDAPKAPEKGGAWARRKANRSRKGTEGEAAA
jgi:Putative transposase DNA-binding domain